MTKEITEEWKRIPECPRYEISSQGRVRSYVSKCHQSGKILKGKTDKYGYKLISLQTGTSRSSNNKTVYRKIHRLVAEQFIPIPEELKHIPKEKLQVDHIIPVSDGGGILNEETGQFNLRWCTAHGNAHNPITMEKAKKRGIELRKKVYQYDEDLNLIATYDSTLDAMEKLNKVSQGNIASCCTGSLHRYLGYIFSYIPLDNIQQREEVEAQGEEQRLKTKANVVRAYRNYYRRNRKKKLESCRKYYQKHKEKIKEYQNRYNQTHKEECRERARKWRQRKRQEKQQLKDGDN